MFVETRWSRGRPGRLKDRKRYGTGNKDEKSVNGTKIFHWEVSTEKTGIPVQEFLLFWKISSGTNQKVVFHLHPNRNFRNFLVNGKRPLCPYRQPNISRVARSPPVNISILSYDRLVLKIFKNSPRNIGRPCVGHLQKRFHNKSLSFSYSLRNPARYSQFIDSKNTGRFSFPLDLKR